jgi:hypothetical protein
MFRFPEQQRKSYMPLGMVGASYQWSRFNNAEAQIQADSFIVFEFGRMNETIDGQVILGGL